MRRLRPSSLRRVHLTGKSLLLRPLRFEHVLCGLPRGIELSFSLSLDDGLQRLGVRALAFFRFGSFLLRVMDPYCWKGLVLVSAVPEFIEFSSPFWYSTCLGFSLLAPFGSKSYFSTFIFIKEPGPPFGSKSYFSR